MTVTAAVTAGTGSITEATEWARRGLHGDAPNSERILRRGRRSRGDALSDSKVGAGSDTNWCSSSRRAEAQRVAIDAVRNADTDVTDVRFVLFDEQTYAAFTGAWGNRSSS
jgi:hypothetical protein